MNKDSFEKALKNKLPDRAVDFDAEAAWKRLEARRKRDKKPLIYWWLTGLALLLISTGVWYGVSMQKQNRTAENNPNQPTQIAQKTTSANTQPSADYTENEDQEFGSNTPEPKTNQHLTEEPVSASQSTGATTKKQNDQKNYTASKEPKPYSPVHRKYAASQSPELLPQKSGNTQLNSSGPERSPSLSGQSEPVQRGARMASRSQALAQIPHRNTSLKEETFTLPKRTIPLAELPAEKRRRRKSIRWEIGLDGEYGLASVERNGSLDSLNLREDEKALDFMLGAVSIRYRMNDNWFIESGIGIGQSVDKIDRTRSSSSTVWDSTLLVGQTLFVDSTTQNTYGGFVTTISTHEEIIYNRYRYLEVPLLVGGDWTLGDSPWYGGFSAGAAFSIWGKPKGSFSNPNGEFVPLSEADYRSAGLLTGLGRLEFGYRTDSWSAGLSIRGRRTFNALDNMGYDEIRQSVGLGLSLKKRF